VWARATIEILEPMVVISGHTGVLTKDRED
jgi:hypothetical protein